MLAIHKNFHVGLSGLQLPTPLYALPEESRPKSRLTYYAQHLNTIEINSSFYKMPIAKTFAKWETLVPGYFSFTIKLLNEFTHSKGAPLDPSRLAEFFQVIYPLKSKACILVQFPPSFHFETGFDKLQELAETIQLQNTFPWKLAFEFRSRSWYNNDVFDLIEQVGGTLVIQDKPGCATPWIDLRSSFLYIRYHGPTGNYRGSYSDAHLQEQALHIREKLDDGKTVFAYFNNTAGDAWANAMTLKKMMLNLQEENL